MNDRPTRAEKADAADRFIAEVDAAVTKVHAAMTVLRERQERGASGRSGPLFTFDADRMYSSLDKARDLLWAAHKDCASYAYDEHQAAAKEAGRD